MSRRIPQVIYISGNRATLYRAPAGQCQLVERFESTPAGLSRLAERIRTQPNAPTRVLVDLLEEELNAPRCRSTGCEYRRAAWSNQKMSFYTKASSFV